MEKLVSIIVPVYNVKNYLDRCVNSILNQNYENYEVLLIDDGSTDGSSEKCDEFMLRDKRIKVFHKTNGGLSDARNFGIEKCKGDYISFVDSDDLIDESFVKDMIFAIQRYNADIVSCNIQRFYDYKELNNLYKDKKEKNAIIFSREEVLKEYFSPMGERIIDDAVWHKIYKRELFDSIRFPKGKLHEDLFVTYLLLDKCHHLVHIYNTSYFYYQSNPNSISNNFGEQNFLDLFDGYILIYDYFKNVSSLQNDLIHFMIIQYLFLLARSYKFRKKEIVKEKIKYIKCWTCKNISKTNYYSKIKKLLIIFSVYNIRIFTFIKSKK